MIYGMIDSLFVLKVPLNTKQTNQGNSTLSLNVTAEPPRPGANNHLAFKMDPYCTIELTTGMGRWVKWVNKFGWVTLVMGQYP